MDRVKAIETPREEEETEAEGEDSSSSGRNGSSSGSGSGSGLGYSADWSSSDSSSERSSMSGRSGGKPEDETLVSVHRLSLREHDAGISSRHDVSHHAREDKDDEAAYKDKQNQAGNQNAGGTGAVDSSKVMLGLLHDVVQQRSASKLMEPPVVLPQWNGVRIEHPMDPRIDLSSVGYANSTDALHRPPNAKSGEVEAHLRLDNYLHLLEAVRPFFSAYGAHEPPQATRSSVENKGPSSSEGCTSFFTTTNSNAGTSDSNSNSNLERAEHVQRVDHHGESPNSKPAAAWAHVHGDDQSETSSLKVQARAKRRHLRRIAEAGTSTNNDVQEKPPNGIADEPGHYQADHFDSSAQGDEAGRDSSMSSSSSDPSQQQPLHRQDASEVIPRYPIPVPPRIVSESSDTVNRQGHGGFSSTTTNTGATNTSGSGSGGNSGSNNGSSGSGNEDPGSRGNSEGNNNNSSGSGNDGKSGENTPADLNSATDENFAPKHLRAESLQPQSSTPQANHDHITPPLPGLTSTTAQAAGLETQAEALERKLLDKKRKRMSMRREYEEQKQLESYDSLGELPLRPGVPMALDEVLSFTKMARLIVQGTPPFLIVHANAAYSVLTGIDSHAMIGQPVSGLISIPSSGQPSDVTNRGSDPTVMTTGHLHAAAAAGRALARLPTEQEMCLERFIAESGFCQYHVIDAAARSQSYRCHQKPRVIHGEDKLERGDYSQDGSISTEEGSFQLKTIKCQAAISPVVSDTAMIIDPGVVTDRDQDFLQAPGKDGNKQLHPSKRRKHHHHPHREAHRRIHNLTTHYVIQLERIASDLAEKLPSIAGQAESLAASSKAVPAGGQNEAPLLAENEELLQMDEEVSDSDPPGPVSAIG